MKLFGFLAIIFGFLGCSTATSAAGCDGNLQVTGPLGCNQALIYEYNQKLVNLYKLNLLDANKHSVRGTCDCTAQGSFVYCSATFDVHQCFQGASGTVWFSSESIIQGGIFASWNTASSDPARDLYGHKASVASRAAEGLIERVKAKSQR